MYGHGLLIALARSVLCDEHISHLESPVPTSTISYVKQILGGRSCFFAEFRESELERKRKEVEEVRREIEVSRQGSLHHVSTFWG